jgi:hypothetical protein
VTDTIKASRIIKRGDTRHPMRRLGSERPLVERLSRADTLAVAETLLQYQKTKGSEYHVPRSLRLGGSTLAAHQSGGLSVE